jgi:hypothetical protein
VHALARVNDTGRERTERQRDQAAGTNEGLSTRCASTHHFRFFNQRKNDACPEIL